MPERFKVVCIPCKVLYKCSALHTTKTAVYCCASHRRSMTTGSGVLCRVSIDHLMCCSYACTSVALWSDLIVGAFGSGHIRIFSSLKGSLLAEVTAHAKWINAINVAPATGMVGVQFITLLLVSLQFVMP